MNSETSVKTDHKIHQWRKFLSNSKDKSLLIKFIAEEWQNERHRERLAGKTIFVTTEGHCYEVSSIGMTTREEVRSTQEEADSRVFLHGPHAAAAGYRAVVITSDATDVFSPFDFYRLHLMSSVCQTQSTDSNSIHGCVKNHSKVGFRTV